MKQLSCGIVCAQIWELSNLTTTNKLCLLDEINHVLFHLIQYQNISNFILAMQLGFPIDIAKILFQLNKQHPITLECSLPYEEQHINWDETTRNSYFDILATCNKLHLSQTHFSVDCFKRNIDYIISSCNTLLFIPSIFPSDVNDAIYEAQKKHRHIVIANKNLKATLTKK